uniref:Uncharacterized protein n=1 Tax=Anguilla anguilla TaxID=7936 RepID=A0A0E9PAU7_ANGAN
MQHFQHRAFNTWKGSSTSAILLSSWHAAWGQSSSTLSIF